MRERAAGFRIPTVFDDVSTEALEFICDNAKQHLSIKLLELAAVTEKSNKTFLMVIPLLMAVGGLGIYTQLKGLQQYDVLILLSFVSCIALIATAVILYSVIVAKNTFLSEHDPARYFHYKSFTRSRDAHRKFLRKEIEIVQAEISSITTTHKKRFRTFKSAMDWLMAMVIADLGITLFYFLLLS